MQYIPEYLHLPVLSEALTNGANKTIPVKTSTPRKAVVPSMQNPAILRTKRSRIRWTSNENKTILRMKKHGCSWEEIHHALLYRTLGAIQVQYSTKLKK
ncbi:hypothetical protein CJF31_00008874 [Rutstroemia sp. NJR-2017a BVV2]|nr:hypothetical protein CJF31_00008874 [Rutstroemia sp. NJR-2017a BVV2]